MGGFRGCGFRRGGFVDTGSVGAGSVGAGSVGAGSVGAGSEPAPTGMRDVIMMVPCTWVRHDHERIPYPIRHMIR